MNNLSFRLLLPVFFIPFCSIAQGEKASWFDRLYEEDVIIPVTVFTEVDSLLARKWTDTETDAKLLFRGGQLSGESWDVRLNTRGRYRRRICDFPPLKVTISKAQLRGKDLKRSYNDYKLVTHCKEDKTSEANILREYLAYRLCNLLTEQSFRVQLVRIHYRDVQDRTHIEDQLGILLEDEDQMAARIGGNPVDTFQLQEKSLQAESAFRHALFQYMIGNADWDLSFNRNLKIVAPEEGPFMVVPYDFDFSGLVDAPYAIPNPDYKLLKVTDRVFLGEAKWTELEGSVQHFLNRKEALLSYCKNFPYLKKRDRKTVRKYLTSFFDDLEKGILYYPAQG